jgi:hypothetical protein
MDFMVAKTVQKLNPFLRISEMIYKLPRNKTNRYVLYLRIKTAAQKVTLKKRIYVFLPIEILHWFARKDTLIPNLQDASLAFYRV